MKVLVDETNATKRTSEIDDMLSGYTEALNVDTPEGDSSHQSDISLGLSETEEDKSDPKLYYQSGKKKGQRRPGADKAKMTIGKKAGSEDAKATLGGEIISGVLFLTLIDLLFPLLISAINNYLSKEKIDANKMRLTASQKKELAPICEEVAKQWEVTANPVTLLITSLIGIYGMNFFQLKMESKYGG